MKTAGLIRKFLHLDKGLVPQEQEAGTVSDSINVRKPQHHNATGYMSSAYADRLIGNLPEGFILRGDYYLEEQRRFVLFGINNGVSEIGIFYEDLKKYVKVVDDTKLDKPLHFNNCKVVRPEVQIFGKSCNNIRIYFSVRNVYRVINIENACCDYSDTVLMKARCVGTVRVDVIEGIGQLRNGTYQVSISALDSNGTETNNSLFTNPVIVAGGNKRVGETTNYGLAITVDDMPIDFNQATIVIREKIDGVEDKVISNVGYGGGRLRYTYTGSEGTYQNDIITKVKSRVPKYFEGPDIASSRGSAIIFNTIPERNWNLQKYVSRARITYYRKAVPLKYADKFTTLRSSEKYGFALKLNWDDGKDNGQRYDFINHATNPGGSSSDNCTNCDLPSWVTKDTSVRTNYYMQPSGGGVSYSPGGYSSSANGGAGGCQSSESCNLTVKPLGDCFEVSVSGSGDIILEDTFNGVSAQGNGSCAINVPASCEGYSFCVSFKNSNGCCEYGTRDIDSLESGMVVGVGLSSVTASQNGGSAGGSQGLGELGNSTIKAKDSKFILEPSSDSTFTGNAIDEGDSVTTRSTGGDPEDGDFDPDACDGGPCEDCECDATWLQNIYIFMNRVIEYFNKIPLISDIEPLEIPKSPCEKLNCLDGFENADDEVYAVAEEVVPLIEGEITYRKTNRACEEEGDIDCRGQEGYKCINGFWHYAENSECIENDPQVEIGSTSKGLPSFSKGDFNGENCETDTFNPIPFSEGVFGYWETEDVYPRVEICNEDGSKELLYGDMTGKKVRLYAVPGQAGEPIYVSMRTGVPSRHHPGNDPDDDTWVILTGIKVDGLHFPKAVTDRLCKSRPFDVEETYRGESDKSVLSTGLLISAFGGKMQSETVATPKNGVNSFEFYDASINPPGNDVSRRGFPLDTASYIYHSPDFHLWGNQDRAQYFNIDYEVYGEGWRYHDYAEGEIQNRWNENRFNNAGRRSGIILNQYKTPAGASQGQPLVKCVKAMRKAEADSFVGKRDEFTYGLNNKYREASQYVELEGDKIPFTKDATGQYGSSDGGDGASDNSFIGDTIDQEAWIFNARSHLATAMRYLPNQYGSIIYRTYIPTGIDSNSSTISSGTMEGLCGDSFIGSFTVKRTAFISDKVKKVVNKKKEGAPIKIPVFKPDGTRRFRKVPRILVELASRVLGAFFQTFVDRFYEILGVLECGTVPKSGDKEHPRSLMSLRGEMRAVTGNEAAFVVGAPTQGIYHDVFGPHLLKTYVKSYFPSDANLQLRGVGDVIIGDAVNNDFGKAEVYFDDLQSLKLDPKFPDGTDFDVTWLSRFYVRMKEPAAWKVLFRNAILLAFNFLPFILLFLKAMDLLGDGINYLVISSFLSIITIGIGMTLVLGGFLWFEIWRRTDLDNKIIDRIFKFDWCRPDIQFYANGAGNGSNYGIRQGRAVQFEKNYYYYNPNFSNQNIEEISFGVEPNPDFSWCPSNRSGLLRASAEQDIESDIDFWSRFKIRDKMQVPRDRGEVMKVYTMQGQLFIHTTASIFRVFQGGQTLQTNLSDVYLGNNPNFFGEIQDLFGGALEGKGGLQDPNAHYVTARGAFWPDNDGRRFHWFTGREINDIPFKGLEDYFDTNMGFFLQKAFPNYTNRDNRNDGIGYGFAINYGTDTIYITKRDWKPKNAEIKYSGSEGFTLNGKKVSLENSEYFENKSFHYSYNLKTGSYNCRHLHNPDYFLWNRFTHYSIKNNGVYTHDVKNRFSEYFGKSEPVYIEMPINGIPEGIHRSFTLKNVIVVGDVYEHFENGTKKKVNLPLFDQIQVVSDNQASRWLCLNELPVEEVENALLNVQDSLVNYNYNQDGNFMTISKVRNDLSGDFPLEVMNDTLQILEPSAYTSGSIEPIRGDQVTIRLLSMKEPQYECVFRKIILQVEYKEEIFA